MHILYSDKVDIMQMKWERRKGMERAINRWKSKIALNTDKTSRKDDRELRTFLQRYK